MVAKQVGSEEFFDPGISCRHCYSKECYCIFTTYVFIKLAVNEFHLQPSTLVESLTGTHININ